MQCLAVLGLFLHNQDATLISADVPCHPTQDAELIEHRAEHGIAGRTPCPESPRVLPYAAIKGVSCSALSISNSPEVTLPISDVLQLVGGSLTLCCWT
jgi:hypothetical protein